MNRIAGRCAAVVLLVVLLLGGLGFFVAEYFAKAQEWVMQEGSPHIYSGTNLGCGTVTDREGYLLLDLNDNRTYAATQELREATLHWLGDRNGYISAPAVAKYAEAMAGYDSITGLYSHSGAGQATLTLSAKIQMAALEAMGEYKGTLAIYNYKTGEILCAVTTPTYDPDHVPDFSAEGEAYEGVYLNRFTQSKYVPGSIFKIVTTAAALEEIEDIREQTFECTGTYDYPGEYDVTCEKVHGTLDFDSAMAQSCNCAYAAIVDQLGPKTLANYVEKYQITAPVSFDGVTTVGGNFDITDASKVQIAWSGIGQHKDEVNICRFLTFMGAIANGGAAVNPYLVSQVTNGDEVTYKAAVTSADPIMPESVAVELQAMMRNNVLEKYGVENFPDLMICAKSGTGQVGGEQEPNAMFAGFVMDEEYPLAFMVAVEDAGYGRHVCIPILSPVLEVCMEVMDAE